MRNGHKQRRAIFERMLKPIGRSFGPETIRALKDFRISKRMQARVIKLAGKCNEGKLTNEELSEYDAYIQVTTVIGILRARARKGLAKTSQST